MLKINIRDSDIALVLATLIFNHPALKNINQVFNTNVEKDLNNGFIYDEALRYIIEKCLNPKDGFDKPTLKLFYTPRNCWIIHNKLLELLESSKEWWIQGGTFKCVVDLSTVNKGYFTSYIFFEFSKLNVNKDITDTAHLESMLHNENAANIVDKESGGALHPHVKSNKEKITVEEKLHLHKLFDFHHKKDKDEIVKNTLTAPNNTNPKQMLPYYHSEITTLVIGMYDVPERLTVAVANKNFLTVTQSALKIINRLISFCNCVGFYKWVDKDKKIIEPLNPDDIENVILDAKKFVKDYDGQHFASKKECDIWKKTRLHLIDQIYQTFNDLYNNIMNYTDQLKQQVTAQVTKELKEENKNKIQEKIEEIKEKIASKEESKKASATASA